MKETIRQHFERVQKNLTRVIVVAGAVLVLGLAFQFPHTSLSRSFLHAIGVVLALAIPGLVFTGFMYRCPRCGASFRKLRIKQLGFRADPRMHWELWNECPRCRLSFDDPWARAPMAGKTPDRRKQSAGGSWREWLPLVELLTIAVALPLAAYCLLQRHLSIEEEAEILLAVTLSAAAFWIFLLWRLR